MSLATNMQMEDINDESVDGLETLETVPKQKSGNAKYIAVIIAVSLIVVVAIVCIVVAVTSNDVATEEITQDKASFVLQDLMNVSEWSESHHTLYNKCFDAFDENGDDYLSEEEFANYFARELDHSATFEAMDVDDDQILSFAETVAYLRAMYSIPEIAELLRENTGPLVASLYQFTLNNASSDEELEIFLQYVAVAVFFDIFDPDLHGYIRHEDYLSISAANEFSAVDEDGDGQLSREEFYDLLFGNDSYSWSGHLTVAFGENKQHVMEQGGLIQVTEEMVNNVSVTICPSTVRQDAETIDEARRLIYCYLPICWYCDPNWCLWLVPCCF